MTRRNRNAAMLTRSVLLEVLFLLIEGTCLSAEKRLLRGNDIISVHNANGTNDLLEVDPATEQQSRRRLHSIEELGLSDAEQQEPGKRWNYQQKFNAVGLINQVQWVSNVYALPPGTCDSEDKHKELLQQVEVWGGAAKATPRIFCGIFTHSKNHFTKVKAIKNTWASRCDGFVVFSDEVDHKIPSFKIKHEGPEEWNNMWQKSRAIWKYIAFHYIDDFDWFFLGGDDVFLIVENLRKYLLSNEIKAAAGGFEKGGQIPLYLGRRFRPKGDDRQIFNSGGAGYLMNRAAVALLAPRLDLDECEAHRKCFWEDVQVAKCLRQGGVEALDTRDCFGRERFHPFTPAQHLMYRPPTGDDWYKEYAIGLKVGRECCSRDSISFHYVDENLMQRLFHLVYSCPKKRPRMPEDLPVAV